MPGATSSVAPQGRSQLLYWLNGLCNADYPAIESLRDGAAYCTILEAAVKRIGENCQAVPTKDAAAASQRAQRASAVVARLDWSATSHVCNDVDPTLDSIMVSASCRKNMEVLREMTMHCIPPDHARNIDVERMARGRFQDHVQFLQWLYQFMAKVLSTYSKAALEEAMSVPTGVEGVKLNRTMRMRQRTASARSSSAQARLRDERRLHTSGLGPRPAPAAARQSSGEDEYDDTVVMDPRESSHDATVRSSTAGATPVQSGGEDHRGSIPTAAAAAPGPQSVPPPVFWDRGAATVPASEKPSLVELRREVEQIEALVLYICDAYQKNLTQSGAPDSAPVPSELVRTCLAKEPALAPSHAPTVSLSELGRLLDERDSMAHLYERIRLLVTQYERKYTSSPLLREVRMLFQPSLAPSEDH